jgi:hypothetical protein
MHIRLIGLLALALAPAGCSNNMGNNNVTQTCSGTFSGMLNGTLGNCLLLTTADPGTMTWTVTAGGTPTGDVKSLRSATTTLAGAPRSGSFPSLKPDLSPNLDFVSTDFEFVAADGTLWQAGLRSDLGGTTSATWSLNITAALQVGGLYQLSGQLAVELVPANQNQPQPPHANLNVTF